MLKEGFGTGLRRIMRAAMKNTKGHRTRATAKSGNIITPERAAAMDRARAHLMHGRTFADSSADLIREARVERTDQL